MSTAALPRVSGRHRNTQLAAARRTRAVELRTAGWTFDAIAAELGYANRGSVYAVIRKALDTHEAEGVERLRELEVARLDRLQANLWDRAMAGDMTAVSEIRRIIEARVRLFGLALEQTGEGQTCATVVCSCAPGTGHRAGDTAGS